MLMWLGRNERVEREKQPKPWAEEFLVVGQGMSVISCTRLGAEDVERQNEVKGANTTLGSGYPLTSMFVSDLTHS